jgi:hypothetical protein
VAPTWLTVLSYVWLALAGLSTLTLVCLVARHREQMTIMNVVWPITGLYMGPFALWAYQRMKVPKAPAGHQQEDGGHRGHQQKGADPPTTFKGVTHCGAGCTLGDIVGEAIVAAAALTISGSPFGARVILDYVLAFMAGIVFQYFSIVPMRGLRPLPGIWAAIKADALSITAFETGMFGWMAVSYFVLFDPPLKPGDPVFLFMMQIAMLIGFATSYPMNWWLIKRGVKEAM